MVGNIMTASGKSQRGVVFGKAVWRRYRNAIRCYDMEIGKRVVLQI